MAPIIHVAVLDEGTQCWHPTHAIHLHDDIYEIIMEAPVDERWEFTKGDRVRCKKHKFTDGKRGLVAYEKAA